MKRPELALAVLLVVAAAGRPAPAAMPAAVGETPAGVVVELIDTLSNVAVVRIEVLSLLTTKPTYTFCAMVIVWLVPAHLLTPGTSMTTQPLDLARELAEYGRDTRSGLGISVPLGVEV